jgi:hypothetical protein
VSIFASGVTTEEALVLLLTQRDGRQWSKYSFSPLLPKKTIVFSRIKEVADGGVSIFFRRSLEEGIHIGGPSIPTARAVARASDRPRSVFKYVFNKKI